MGASSLFHTRWDCSYHIIFIPKFRWKTFFKEVRREVGEIFGTLCEYKNVELVKGEHQRGSRTYVREDTSENWMTG
ncbi:MAG: transposase [Bacilli bacterium]